MSNIIPFEFEGNAVRSTVIDDKPWFVASDLAKVLAFRDASNAIRYLDDDEKGTLNGSTPGGRQDLIIVNESGLYALILKSRKASAKRFKKWVTAEVLPTIRKTGGYKAKPKTQDNPAQSEPGHETMRDLIESQKEVLRLGGVVSELNSQHGDNMKDVAKILVSKTTLTDQEISDLMEPLTETNMPEWVAWQRRIAVS